MPKALTIQADHTIYLDCHDPGFYDALADLPCFATLDRSSNHLIVYKIDPKALQRSAKAGLTSFDIEAMLEHHSLYAIPESIRYFIHDMMDAKIFAVT